MRKVYLATDKKTMIDSKGFTLIELMVTVMIFTVLAAIALPSYQAFIKKNNIQFVKSLLLGQSNELNRWRARQLNYAGFIPQSYEFAEDNMSYKNLANVGEKYDIKLVTIIVIGDSALQASINSQRVATNYVIFATPRQAGFPYIALSSRGIRCESNDSTVTPLVVFNNNNCGTGSKSW